VGPNFLAAKVRATAPREPKEEPPFWRRLDQMPVPTLFIFGEQDRGQAGKRSRLALEQFPGLNLHLLPNCKHLVPWDQPDELVRLVADFLTPASDSSRSLPRPPQW